MNNRSSNSETVISAHTCFRQPSSIAVLVSLTLAGQGFVVQRFIPDDRLEQFVSHGLDGWCSNSLKYGKKNQALKP